MAYGPICNDREREAEDFNTGERATSCLFLPAIPGVTIKTFYKRYFLESLCPELISSIVDQKDIKYLAFFIPDNEEAGLFGLRLLEIFMERHECVAIWGGIANKLTVCKKSHKKKACGVPVTLAGWSVSGKDVSAWSVVIDLLCKTKEQVEERLTSFKAEVDLRKYSVGFKFSNCFRGSFMFDERNVESGIFRKLFPGVPLVGTFGKNEFGRTTVTGDASLSNSPMYWGSTVFMILSYG